MIYLVVGLGFGDEGKGSIVDALTRRTGADLVVRFNGGCQAGHNVVTDTGAHHLFSQFGAGTLAGANTFLSRFMMVEPLAMISEARHLREITGIDPFRRMVIDHRAPIITPYHRAMNMMRETARGANRHGSCGVGIGELADDLLNHPLSVIRAGELHDTATVYRKMNDIRARKLSEARALNFDTRQLYDYLLNDDITRKLVEDFRHFGVRVGVATNDWLEDHLNRSRVPVIFEGAQGVLLDETHGFQPYTTWSDCTFNNAMKLLDEARYTGHVEKIGVIRAFHTRHGPGPFPTEDPELLKLAAYDHNHENTWQGAFRVGHLDVPLLKYSLWHVLGGVDSIALTCLDRVHDGWTMALRYKNFKLRTQDDANLLSQLSGIKIAYFAGTTVEGLVSTLANLTGTPVGIESYGATSSNKVFSVNFALAKR